MMSLHHFRQPSREQLVCGKKLLVPKRPSTLCVGIARFLTRACETMTCSSQEWWSHTVHKAPILVQSSSHLRLLVQSQSGKHTKAHKQLSHTRGDGRTERGWQQPAPSQPEALLKEARTPTSSTQMSLETYQRTILTTKLTFWCL